MSTQGPPVVEGLGLVIITRQHTFSDLQRRRRRGARMVQGVGCHGVTTGPQGRVTSTPIVCPSRHVLMERERGRERKRGRERVGRERGNPSSPIRH